LTSRADRIGRVTRIAFLALLALIAIGYPLIFFVFVPVLGWFVWRDQDRITALERRVASLERPPEPKPEPPSMTQTG
jgi:hypothetical protein